MQIGYARVSSVQQNLDRQLGALRAQRCEKIFTEKVSGKSLKGRPQLERAIDMLGTGDVLVVAEWDRATRSMMDGITIMQRVHARGAAVKVLDKPHLDLTTAIGRGFLAFLSALAEDERERIHKRAAEGRQAASRKGCALRAEAEALGTPASNRLPAHPRRERAHGPSPRNGVSHIARSPVLPGDTVRTAQTT